MLDGARNDGWRLEDFEWGRPLGGTAAALSARAKKEAGLLLVFTAGLERKASQIFGLCASYAEDPRAREIYRLFEADETRHADAEVKLAARYGVTPADLPKLTTWALDVLGKNLEHPDRGVYEMSSAMIVLFELALDSILIPVLRAEADDPLERAVFRRIDIDEARHLAMDYWLLEAKGRAAEGKSRLQALEAVLGPLSVWDRVNLRLRLGGVLVQLMIALGRLGLEVKELRPRVMDPALIEKYLERVESVPRKAPHARHHPAYAMSLTGHRWVMAMLDLLRKPAPERASA